jgi:hypothetical protein
MVIGLDTFKEYFKAYQDCYLIIGGTACDILMEEAALTPRATNDIDVILIIEAIEPEFVKQFWSFVKEGEYAIQQKETEKRNCYRFRNPGKKDFPKQVELFCRESDVIDLAEGAHLTPIPTEEGLSSLSAILLDEDYYQYTIQNSEHRNDVHFASPQTLICLKAFAFISNTERAKNGHRVQSGDISKHKNDVFRMVLMLPPDIIFETPEKIKTDLQAFVDAIKKELPSSDIFTNNGFGQVNINNVFSQFIKSFQLNG